MPALFQAAPKPPAPDVTIYPSASGDVFADRSGKSLYVFLCSESSEVRLPCDVTTPIHRLALCGGPEKCNQTWIPLRPSPGAKSSNHLWSLIQLNPTTGERLFDAKARKGMDVWAYRGRPVYTYAGDKEPGETNGGSAHRLYLVMTFELLRTVGPRGGG
jgi:hypothetical protein